MYADEIDVRLTRARFVPNGNGQRPNSVSLEFKTKTSTQDTSALSNRESCLLLDLKLRGTMFEWRVTVAPVHVWVSFF